MHVVLDDPDAIAWLGDEPLADADLARLCRGLPPGALHHETLPPRLKVTRPAAPPAMARSCSSPRGRRGCVACGLSRRFASVICKIPPRLGMRGRVSYIVAASPTGWVDGTPIEIISHSRHACRRPHRGWPRRAPPGSRFLLEGEAGSRRRKTRKTGGVATEGTCNPLFPSSKITSRTSMEADAR
jgi:hypothetical protein